MTKFSSRQDPGYVTFMHVLKRWKNSTVYRTSSVGTTSDIDVNQYRHHFGNIHASVYKRKLLIDIQVGDEIKAQGDSPRGLSERGITQVSQYFREPYRKLTEEKAQEPYGGERSMAEGQHIVDPATSETFGFVDSAYGTASHGRDNERLVTHSAFMKRIDFVEEDRAEAVSVYSKHSTTASVIQNYLQDLVDDLFSAVYTPLTNPKRLQRLCKILEQLLQQFAFRIGVEISSIEGRKILYHVHRNRRLVFISTQQDYK